MSLRTEKTPAEPRVPIAEPAAVAFRGCANGATGSIALSAQTAASTWGHAPLPHQSRSLHAVEAVDQTSVDNSNGPVAAMNGGAE